MKKLLFIACSLNTIHAEKGFFDKVLSAVENAYDNITNYSRIQAFKKETYNNMELARMELEERIKNSIESGLAAEDRNTQKNITNWRNAVFSLTKDKAKYLKRLKRLSNKDIQSALDFKQGSWAPLEGYRHVELPNFSIVFVNGNDHFPLIISKEKTSLIDPNTLNIKSSQR